MAKQKLLIVEDDPNLGQILKEYLEMKGYEARLCVDGEAGLEAFRRERYDFCILDVMMPKKDGFSLAEDIRREDQDTPLLFLTAKSMKEDAIRGLRLGADDYITKPFSMEELLLRIQAIMRRSGNKEEAPKTHDQYQLGKLSFIPARQILKKEDKEISLTARESDLLALLCQYQNKTLPRSEALMQLWGDDSYFNARSMDVFITKLRKHFKEDEQVQILTITGQGFRLVVIND